MPRSARPRSKPRHYDLVLKAFAEFDPFVLKAGPPKVCRDRVAFKEDDAFHILFELQSPHSKSAGYSKVLDFARIMSLQIRRAKPDEAAVLTEIAHAAKRHWGYPENWIRHWKADLTITPEFIANNEMYVATNGEEIVGCCAIAFNESVAELEHMWIRPEHIGTGVGRALFLHVKKRAGNLKVPSLEISADPNAEGFYERMGAKRIGEVRSEIEGQPRVLPRMTVNLSSEHKKEPPGWIKD